MQEIGGLIQDYELYLRGEGRSEKYIMECTRVLHRFRSFLEKEGKFDIEELNKHDLRKWIIQLRGAKAFQNHPSIHSNGRPLSKDTLRDYVQNIKGWGRFLWREDYLELDPFAKVDLPKPSSKEKEPLTNEASVSLLDEAKASTNPVRDRAILYLLYDTCIRRDEVRRLKVEDVHLGKDLGKDPCVKVHGKGGEEEIVALSVRAQRELSRYLRVRPASQYKELFLSNQGTPLTGSGIYQLVKRIARAAGVEAYPHLVRHTAATLMAEAGMDLKTLQRILRHKSPAQSMRYIHPRQQFINSQHQRYSPLDTLLSKRNR